MRSTYQMTTSSAKKYCNCNGNFNIPYNGHPNNPACLQSIPSYGRCNTNAQCYQVDESYACVNHVCQCVGQWTLIKGHRPQVKCLAPAKPNQRCLYDEACTYGDPNSYCIETCQCKDGYKVDVTGDYCAGTQLNMTISKCTPLDFEDGNSCDLICTVNTVGTDYALQSQSFIYYSTDPSVNVTIFEAMYFNDTKNHNYQAVLRLSNYSSGNYQCDFTFNDTGDGTINNQMAVFQISTKTGAPLNSPCGSSSDCATLNAQCDTGETGGSAATCKCSGFFDINYTDDSNMPACLPPVSETGKCNTAAQCFQQDQDYNCTSDSKCECLGQKIAVAEKHDEIMCLGGVAMYDPCIYSEQCYLSTNNSHCSNAQCNCIQGYKFNETVSICYEIHVDYEPRFSNSAIFGILFGCALGIALIVAVVLKRKVTVTFNLRDGFGIKINHKDDGGGIEYCFNWCIFGHKGC